MSVLELPRVPEFRQMQAQVIIAAEEGTRGRRINRLAKDSNAWPVVNIADLVKRKRP